MSKEYVMNKFAILSLLYISLAQYSFASDTTTGKLEEIGGVGLGDNTVYFGVNPSPNNKPACSNHNKYDYVIDISTDKGKAIYSMLLMARTTQSNITIQGSGSCLAGSNIEEIRYWILQP